MVALSLLHASVNIMLRIHIIGICDGLIKFLLYYKRILVRMETLIYIFKYS